VVLVGAGVVEVARVRTRRGACVPVSREAKVRTLPLEVVNAKLYTPADLTKELTLRVTQAPEEKLEEEVARALPVDGALL
jgi:hypothetical protein